MIHSWDTFRGWIEENREQLRLRRSLTDSAKEWEKRAKDPSYLYRGGRLEDVEAWANSSQVALNATELAFLETSLALRDREARQKMAALKHQKRLTKRFQIPAVVASVLAVLSIGLFFWANIQRQNAEQAKHEAFRQLGNVDSQLGMRARDDEKDILGYSHFFFRSAKEFQCAHIAALAKNATLAGALASRALVSTFPHGTDIRGAVFDRDGSRILTWSGDGTARLLGGESKHAAPELQA